MAVSLSRLRQGLGRGFGRGHGHELSPLLPPAIADTARRRNSGSLDLSARRAPPSTSSHLGERSQLCLPTSDDVSVWNAFAMAFTVDAISDLTQRPGRNDANLL